MKSAGICCSQEKLIDFLYEKVCCLFPDDVIHLVYIYIYIPWYVFTRVATSGGSTFHSVVMPDINGKKKEMYDTLKMPSWLGFVARLCLSAAARFVS